MGVDAINKPKVPTTVPKTVEAKPVEAPKEVVAAVPAAEAKKAPSEGFDLTKKKLMSVSGRFAQSKTKLPENTDLKDLIAKQRLGVQAGNVTQTAKSESVQLEAMHDDGDEIKTIASKGKDPAPRAAESDFQATRAKPIGKAEAEALKKKGYTEASSGKAIEELKTKPKPISGKDMMNAIVSGSSDLDNHAASSEYKDIQKFAKDNWKSLSPEAQANFKTYEAAVQESQAKKNPGIPAARFEQMVEKMQVDTTRAAIEKDFGVKVKEGKSAEIGDDLNPKKKTWTSEELMRVHESFSNMPKADQAKLKGIDLVRDSRAEPKSETEAGHDHGNQKVAGEYMPNVQTPGGKREIHLYDGAFPENTKATTESRKDSISVITHEAGHAVEARARDDAGAAFNVAVNKEKDARVPVEAARKEVNEALGEAPKKKGEKYPDGSYNRATSDFGRTSDKAKLNLITKQKAVEGAWKKLEAADTPEKLKAAKESLATTTKARDEALKGTNGDPKSQAIVDASRTVEQKYVAYAEANVKLTPFTEAKAEKLKEYGKVANLVDKTVDGKTFKVPGKTSKELDAFVKARGKESAPSPYGAKSGAEGYAEAYALYQRDPKFMAKHFPKQYEFFHKNHQNAQD